MASRKERYGKRLSEVEQKPMSKYAKDIAGQRFGRLVVKEYYGVHPHSGGAYWVCECDCGKTCIKSAHELQSGCALSCGCLH